MRGKTRSISMFIPAGTLLFPADVFAHSLSKRFGDFYGGLLHPLTSLEFGMGFLGVALVVAQQGKQGARSTLGWFLGALCLGTVAAPRFAGFENEIRLGGLLATALLGVLAAIALRLRAASLPAVGLRWSSENGHPVKPHRPIGRFSQTRLDSGSPDTNAASCCCRTS